MDRYLSDSRRQNHISTSGLWIWEVFVATDNRLWKILGSRLYELW